MLLSECLLGIILLFSCFDSAHPRRKRPTLSSENHNWDVLLFNQQWLRTGCEEWMNYRRSNKCSRPRVPNSWGIHGIWPTKYGSFGPFYCNRSAQFDLNAVKPIVNELSEVWSTFRHDSPNHYLWAHEWNKHGTCAAILESFNTEFKYLARGIEYYKTYNISEILREADIVPSYNKGYDVLDIVDAIRARLGVNPIVKCKKMKNKNSLYDISICFSKELKIYNCDGVQYDRVIGSSDVLTNCDRHRPVLYLPHSSSSYI